MKTIEQAATKAYNIEVLSSGCNAGATFGKEMFKKGVEFAQRWIPVEEEMPEIGVEVLVKYNDELGTVHPNPAIGIDYSVYTSHTTTGFSIEVDYSNKTKEKVTHWRPISFL